MITPRLLVGKRKMGGYGWQKEKPFWSVVGSLLIWWEQYCALRLLFSLESSPSEGDPDRKRHRILRLW